VYPVHSNGVLCFLLHYCKVINIGPSYTKELNYLSAKLTLLIIKVWQYTGVILATTHQRLIGYSTTSSPTLPWSLFLQLARCLRRCSYRQLFSSIDFVLFKPEFQSGSSTSPDKDTVILSTSCPGIFIDLSLGAFF